jgi:hypothetical protein
MYNNVKSREFNITIGDASRITHELYRDQSAPEFIIDEGVNIFVNIIDYDDRGDEILNSSISYIASECIPSPAGEIGIAAVRSIKE